jgi:membrane AbrB-like protein
MASVSPPPEQPSRLHKALGRHFGSFGTRGRGVQWTVMLILSTIFTAVLEALALPAALLLGPMVAAIAVAAAEGTLRVPRVPFFMAQAVIGCMIARSITPEIVGTMVQDWPLFLGAVFSVIAVSAVIGLLLTHWRVLPGTTAVWGSCPGAASAMTLMAEAFGADVRLVAFMQYLRVVLVTVVASIVSRIWVTPAAGHAAGATGWLPAIQWLPLAETLALAGAGAFIAPLLRIPAGPMLVPMVAGALLHGSGTMTIELPPWLLAASYAVIGWSIGLRFTRPILVHALRALPRVTASILALIAICGGLAWVLTWTAGIDPLTAYLATSPGGADSVAIIAASSNVDVPFVMALQTMRFLVVLFVGPSLSRFIARRTGASDFGPLDDRHSSRRT